MELQYLYDIYLDLRMGQEITFTEIKSYTELNNILLSPYEIKVIVTIYRIVNEVFSSD